MLVCLFAFLTLDNLKSGNWRALLGLSSIPAGIIFFASLFLLKESPRFLLIEGKLNIDQACKILKMIARINNNKEFEISDN